MGAGGLFNPGALLQQQVQSASDNLFRRQQADRQQAQFDQEQENFERQFTLKQQQLEIDREAKDVQFQLDVATRMPDGPAKTAKIAEVGERVGLYTQEEFAELRRRTDPKELEKKIIKAGQEIVKCGQDPKHTREQCDNLQIAIFEGLKADLQALGASEEVAAGQLEAINPREIVQGREDDRAVELERREAEARTTGEINAQRAAGVPLSGGSTGTAQERRDARILDTEALIAQGMLLTPEQDRQYALDLRRREQEDDNPNAVISGTTAGGTTFTSVGSKPGEVLGTVERRELKQERRELDRVTDLADDLISSTHPLNVGLVGTVKGTVQNFAELVRTNREFQEALAPHIDALRSADLSDLSDSNRSLIQKALDFDPSLAANQATEVLLAGSIAAIINSGGRPSDQDFRQARKTIAESAVTGNISEKQAKLGRVRDIAQRRIDKLSKEIEASDGPPPVSRDRLVATQRLLANGDVGSEVITGDALRLIIPRDRVQARQWWGQFTAEQRSILKGKLR